MTETLKYFAVVLVASVLDTMLVEPTLKCDIQRKL